MFIEKKTKIKASKIAKFLKLKLNFKDFYLNHQKYMRIKDYDDFLKYIIN